MNSMQRTETASGRPVGVDRENRVLRGYTMAQVGEFKSGRGQFTLESLQEIVTLARREPVGLRARFTHPTMSSDGLGTYLGRVKDVRLDGDKVRGDLHFSGTANNTPQHGDLAAYVLDLAEEDSNALSSSLVLKREEIEILDERGRPKMRDDGTFAPPIWKPTKLHASDIVDTGDAVDGLLSSHDIDWDSLPDALHRQASQMLDGVLRGFGRDEARERLLSFVSMYLDDRYGRLQKPEEHSSGVLRHRLRLLVGQHKKQS